MNLDQLLKLTENYDRNKFTPKLADNIEDAFIANLGINSGEGKHSSRVRVWAGYVFLFFTVATGAMALAASAKLVSLDTAPFAGCWGVFIVGMGKLTFSSLKR